VTGAESTSGIRSSSARGGTPRAWQVLLLGVALVAAAPEGVPPPSPAPTGSTPPASATPESAPAARGDQDLKRAGILAAEGHFKEAEELARTLVSAAERDHGACSTQVADALDVLVGVLIGARRSGVPETLDLARRSVECREALPGDQGLPLATSLGNLGAVLRAQGQHAEAETAARRALDICERTLAPDDPAVARALDGLARIEIDHGDLTSAEPLLVRAAAILEKAQEPEYPDQDAVLNDLGVLKATAGDFPAAATLFRRTLAIREKALGPDHPVVARSLQNLGVILATTGDYAEARPILERALALNEKLLGPDHPSVGFCLFSLGTLLMDVGDLEGAQQRLERSLAIRRKAFGDDNPDVAATLFNLGTLHLDLGEDMLARTLTEQALQTWEKVLGPDHFRVGEALRQLAFLEVRDGHLDAAGRSYERARDVVEKSLGPESPALGVILDGLAEVLRLSGDLSAALAAQERAVAIIEKTIGTENQDAGSALSHQARILSLLGRHAEARTLHRRAVAILEEALTPPHPALAAALESQAEDLALNDERPEALAVALRAETIGREFQRLVTGALPEQGALLLAATRASGLDLVLTLAAAGGDDAAVAAQAWDALVRSRAIVLDEMAARHRSVGAATDAETARLAADLRAASMRLANLMVRGAGAGASPTLRRSLDQAVAGKDAAERALAQHSAAFRRALEGQDIGLQAVAGNRPAGGALVAYAIYNGQGPMAARSYVAFVLPASSDNAFIVPLGPADEIDRLVTRWRAEVAQGISAGVGPDAAAAAEAGCRKAGEELRRSIWDPVSDRLGRADLVLIVPDGLLNLVSFVALPAGQAEYLIERLPPLQYVSAERDIASFPSRADRGKGFFVIDDPTYDAAPSASARVAGHRAAGAAEPGAAASTAVYRGAASQCEAFRSLQFRPLPGTKAEARQIERLWEPAEVLHLTAAEASEAAFKTAAPGHRVVHLATHGFFLGGECFSADSPLLLSGLALAGANRRAQAGLDQEDGILTSEEIAAMDLSGVEWAVLSACDTGSGATRTREGVLGLRRAFQVAGSRTVIMSLWPVEDRAAKSWMGRLYEGRLERGLDTAAAVQQATLGSLRDRRAKEHSTHPIFWAGFVAAGDWR